MTDERWERKGFSFCGAVRHGRARGRQLGFPTANLEVETTLVPPVEHGVYAGCAAWEDGPTRGVVVNIGVRPTFTESKLSVEVHVLDFDGDLYGKRIAVTLFEKLRDEKHFPCVDKLIEQIAVDVEQARAIWRERTANNPHTEE